MNQDIKITNFNPNPKCFHPGKASDTMIRAICKITGLEWENVYNRLCKRGLEIGCMPHTISTVREEFKDIFDHIVIDKNKPQKTGVEFILEHQAGSYIIVTNRYVFAVVDGVIYDAISKPEIDKSINFNTDIFLHDMMFNRLVMNYFVLKNKEE